MVPSSSRTPSHRSVLRAERLLLDAPELFGHDRVVAEQGQRILDARPEFRARLQRLDPDICGIEVRLVRQVHHDVPGQRVTERRQLHQQLRRLLRMEDHDVEHVRPDLGQSRQQRLGDLPERQRGRGLVDARGA